jgi:hypothetical protein
MTVVAQLHDFESWYQQTLAPVAKQLGVSNGKEIVKELLEDNGFEFIEDEKTKILPSKQTTTFNKERAEA